jgi:hypothetical protein
MKMNQMILSCPDCSSKWREALPLPMLLSVAIKRMKAMGICPKCGKKNVVVLLGKHYEEADKILREQDEKERAVIYGDYAKFE